MAKKLPLYKLVLTDEDEGVDYVSFVDSPVIEQDFFAFAKEEDNQLLTKFKVDPKRRIVMGAMMLPDIPIYRNNGKEEFMVVFDKQTIEKVAQKFFKKGLSNNVNVDHSQKVEGVHLYQSFITDKETGVQAPKGYPKVPEGSWFGAYKVENDAVWQSVLNGTFKGFSIEGLFNKQPVKMSILEEVEYLFKDIN